MLTETPLRLLSAIGLTIGLLATAAHAAEPPSVQFESAMRAPGTDATGDSRALREYPLYPYLQAARLQQRLRAGVDAALDADIRAFIDEHGDPPYVRGLRLSWWLSLATRGRWSDYLSAVGDMPADPLLRCHWLRAHLALNRADGLRELALDTWMTGQDMPAACDPVFDWLRTQGALTADHHRQRLRMALNANQLRLARFLIRSLPEAEQRDWTNGILVREQRQNFIPRLISNPDAPVPFDDLLAGFFRYARGNSQPARVLMERLLEAREFSTDEAGQLMRASALALSYSRDSAALELFRRLPASARDADVMEWHARASLWAGDWDELSKVLDAMSAEQRGEARWRYWTARAREQAGDARGARAAYRALAGDERNYYGFMAAARGGVAPRLDPVRAELDPDAQAQLAELPAVVRTRELLALEMRNEAMAELRWAFADLDSEGRVQVARMLEEWGWYDHAIVWLAEAAYWDDLWLRFPLPWRDEFETAAEEAGIPVVWLYTIARTESLFNPRALSPVGARGIAQVMPATATATARRYDIPYRGGEHLYDIGINLRLGAAYIRQMLDRFGDSWLFAVPAYNAGPGRIPHWLPSEADAPMDADIWIENIPFNETRGYIQRALYHRVIIGWRLTGEAEALDSWLHPVPADLSDRAD